MTTKYAVARDRAWQWRSEAMHIQRERNTLRDALADLVELKDLNARIAAGDAGSAEELEVLHADFQRRLPRAWRAARAVLERIPRR